MREEYIGNRDILGRKIDTERERERERERLIKGIIYLY